jgi:hypothetical protein
VETKQKRFPPLSIEKEHHITNCVLNKLPRTIHNWRCTSASWGAYHLQLQSSGSAARSIEDASGGDRRIGDIDPDAARGRRRSRSAAVSRARSARRRACAGNPAPSPSPGLVPLTRALISSSLSGSATRLPPLSTRDWEKMESTISLAPSRAGRDDAGPARGVAVARPPFHGRLFDRESPPFSPMTALPPTNPLAPAAGRENARPCHPLCFLACTSYYAPPLCISRLLCWPDMHERSPL